MQAYRFSTTIDEGPSEPEQVGCGEVALRKALNGWFSVDGFELLTVEAPQHFLVCLEGQRRQLFFVSGDW